MLRRLSALPTLPAVAARLVDRLGRLARAANAEKPAAEGEVLDLICSDPSLAARTLALAGRLPGRSVRTVEQAVDALGMDSLRSALLSAGAMPGPDDDENAFPLDRPAFWRHSIVVAEASEMLAARLELSLAPGEAFTCGLLHDIGKLALALLMPKTYRRLLDAAAFHGGGLARHERKAIGTDHTIAGRRLAELWRLPRNVAAAIWMHHQPLEAIPPSVGEPKLCAVVGLADAVSAEMETGFSGNATFPRSRQEMTHALGLPEQAVQDVLDALPGKVNARARRLGLDEPAPPPARTLAAANDQLARLNADLEDRHRRSGPRAEACDRLQQFFGRLSPEADVADVLSSAADMLAGACGVAVSPSRPLGVFAIGGGGRNVLVGLRDGSDEPRWRTLTAAADLDSASEPPPAAAGPAMARVVANPGELGQWLDLDAATHIPFSRGGAWIGGALLPVACSPECRAVVDLVLPAIGAALAMARQRSRADRLAEELASASQVLAEMQDSLAEFKTLAALGDMAAGAAHEMNNPLAVISGRAQLMKERAATDADRKTWGQIAQQAQRISDIITELMEYAQPRTPRPEAIEVQSLLQDAVRRHSARVDPQAAPPAVDIVTVDVPPIRADREQVLAVLEELISNAANACRNGQAIRLSAEADEVNRTVLLAVEDSGAGMDEETLASAFTPFFSQQDAGRRTGLGLPKAKRLVEINRGRIWIRSRPGRGTTVYVQWPQESGE